VRKLKEWRLPLCDTTGIDDEIKDPIDWVEVKSRLNDEFRIINLPQVRIARKNRRTRRNWVLRLLWEPILVSVSGTIVYTEQRKDPGSCVLKGMEQYKGRCGGHWAQRYANSVATDKHHSRRRKDPSELIMDGFSDDDTAGFMPVSELPSVA